MNKGTISFCFFQLEEPNFLDFIFPGQYITEKGMERIKMRFLRLGPSGIRGAVGTALTCQLAIRYASAFGTWLDGGTVGVAIDSRTSSPMFKAACLSGLLSCGCNVMDFGVCPAPVLHFAVRKLGLDGGLLIGPGHHQAGWNAIVPFSSRGSCLSPIQSQEMLDIYHGGIFSSAKWNRIGRILPAPPSILDEYVEDLAGLVDVGAIADRHFRVVMDFCNGSGSVLRERITDRFGIDSVPINDILSGSLPHDPEPRPRSSAQEKSIMLPLHADAGFVFSSDAGRVAIVTDTGETLSEEYTVPIVADNLLAKSPKGAVVVTNWCSTKTLDMVVASHGGVICKGQTGEAYTIDLMFEKNAILAGEGSGSVAVASSGTYGFDGFAAMILTLESMALKRKRSSEIAGDLPRWHITKLSIPCQSFKAYSALRSLTGLFPDAVMTECDGLRFDWPDGWVHVRMSMTEPILRMIFEWRDPKEAVNKVTHIRAAVERLIAQ